MLKSIVKITAIFAVISLFSACKKNWNELGSQLVAEGDMILLAFDSLEINATIHPEDSLSSLNTATSLIGSLNDPDFGITDASIYTEFRIPSSDVVFGEFSVADSMVLSLKIDSYYGDTSSVMNFNVNRMLEEILTSATDISGEDSTITYYSNHEFEYDNASIGSLSYYPTPQTSKIININLSTDLAQSFLDASSSNFTDNEAFQTFFNGLYISCDQAAIAGAILKLDLLDEASKMTLYYHNTESDSLSYDFHINSNADKMTHWEHDYSATNIENLLTEENLEVAYIQGGAGLRTYITLPTLASLKDSNYVVHKAELVFPYFFSENDSLFDIPSKLGLAAVNSNGELEVLTEDQNIQGAVYFDGNANYLEQNYTFNIVRYIHKVIKEGYTNKLALYVPASVLNPESVLVSNNSENPIQLKLFVSKQ